MSKIELSKKAHHLLETAGWFSCRSVDITDAETFLKQEGYSLNDVVQSFLREFYGLTVEFPDKHAADCPQLPLTNEFHFNAMEAAGSIFRNTVELYEKEANEPLVVIGEAYHRHLVLMISFSGMIYGGYDSYFALLGNDISEAIDTIMDYKFIRKFTIFE